ncbi:MAG: hypothetical protein RL318_1797 [Fibrobacterota bacterium]|jgi:anti-sigma B factor antagonist
MRIEKRTINGNTVLDVAGQIRGVDVATFRQAIQECQKLGELHLVVNMREVSFIDSAGVGMLIHCLQEIKAKNGDLRLLSLPEDIHDLFEMVAIDRFFAILQEESEI